MLAAPPPGYNPSAVNNQNIGALNIPGQQGHPAQGYYNPYRSSFSMPSSYAVPSSVDVPNPYYNQPQHPANMMANALRGAQ